MCIWLAISPLRHPPGNQIRALVVFMIMINDLVVENARLWKHVDDNFISEKVPKGPGNLRDVH